MSSAKDNIVFGGELNFNATENSKSLAEFALKQFEEIGEKKTLIEAATGKEYSGKDLLDKVKHLATCLRNLNIKEGDAVGICCENRLEYIVVTFATFCVNATLAPFNVTYTERELHHAVNLSRPKVLFVSTAVAEKASKVVNKNSFIKHTYVFSDKSPVRSIKSYFELINDVRVKRPTNFVPKPANIKENVALILCSSGTTGLPKGVQLTQKNIMTALDGQFDTKVFLEEATVLSVIPWFHSYGCMTMIVMSCLGARLVYLPKFEEHLFLRAIQDYKVNAAFVVPPLMVFLAKHPMVDNYDLSSLLALLCGAAPLRKETEDAVRNRIGVPIIRQGYGLSECTLSVTIQTDEFCKPGSVGILKRGTYGKVIDTETGKPLGPNQLGELCFKGDFIMKGYVGDQKSTQTMIDKEGWLHTGDIGYYDNDFEFFIVDRIKELIKYKAFQVPPAEIESLLLTHPGIKDAAVVGLPDEECGELPLAFVVKQPNVDLTGNEIVDFIAKMTSPAKRLRGGVRFVESIPKNASGKILRRVLRDMLKEKPKSKL